MLLVAGVAAYVSYAHAYEVVRAHGEGELTARLVPLTVDGLVFASSMVLLYCARHGLDVPKLARWTLALGIAATLAANVAHGIGHGPVGAAIAAWPAVALVLGYELLMWLVRVRADSGEGTPERAQDTDDDPNPQIDMETVAPPVTAPSNPGPTAATDSPADNTTDTDSAADKLAAAREAATQIRNSGHRVTRTALRAYGITGPNSELADLARDLREDNDLHEAI